MVLEKVLVNSLLDITHDVCMRLERLSLNIESKKLFDPLSKDIKAFILKTQPYTERWMQALRKFNISVEEFEFLIKGLAPYNEMKETSKLGITRANISRINKLVIYSITKYVLRII